MADFLNNPFIKTRLSDLPEEAWTYLSGQGSQGELAEVYRKVPYVFRGVDLRANAVASMPFSIYNKKTKEEIDNSETYENKIGFWEDPIRTLGQIEAALCIWGCAYLSKEANRFRPKDLRYMVPSTIKPDYDNNAGVKGFARNLGNGQEPRPLQVSDVVYFWPRDPWVEIGPATTSPAQAAAAAAGVLLNIDQFAAAFFKRGAIKATILTVAEDTQPGERERLEKWWQKVVNGIRNAWTAHVMNGEAVKPTVVGEGLESLSDTELTQEKREAIATALGIPHSVLFSTAASGLGGGGVAEQDDVHFLNKTVKPDCLFVQTVMNRQLFLPLGYFMRFHPEELDVFQEDENQRANSVTTLTTALENPLSEIAMDILGYEIGDENMDKLRRYWASKGPVVTEPETPPAGQVDARGDQERSLPAQEEVLEETLPDEALADLRSWRRKAVKRAKTGRGGSCPFESKVIPPALQGAIAGALSQVQEPAEVDAIFADVWRGYP